MIVLAGEAGLAGLLDRLKTEEGKQVWDRLPPSFRQGFTVWAQKQQEIWQRAEMPEDAEALTDGLFQALWRLGERYRTGFRIQLEALRPHQYVIELCERLNVNPYRLPGLGYAACRETAGERERVVGAETPDRARIIEGPAGERFLAPPERGY